MGVRKRIAVNIICHLSGVSDALNLNRYWHYALVATTDQMYRKHGGEWYVFKEYHTYGLGGERSG